MTSTPVLTVNEGTVYTYDVNANDADGNPLTYSLTTAPAWLSINPITGLITGTAPFVSANTAFSIVVSINDGNGGIITQSYTLTVINTSGTGSGGSGGGASGSGGHGVRVVNLNNGLENENYYGAKTIKLVEEESPIVKQSGLSWLKIFLFWLLVLILILAILIIIVFLTR